MLVRVYWNGGKHSIVVSLILLMIDQMECNRNQLFLYCQVYWKPLRTICYWKGSPKCTYCASKITLASFNLYHSKLCLMWRVADANHGQVQTHKQGHSFIDKCRNTWMSSIPLFDQHVKCTMHGHSFATLVLSNLHTLATVYTRPFSIQFRSSNCTVSTQPQCITTHNDVHWSL